MKRLHRFAILFTLLPQIAMAEVPAKNPNAPAQCKGEWEEVCRFQDAPAAISDDGVITDHNVHLHFLTLRPLTFVAADGTEWQAPKNTLTDGASIPSLLVSMVGDPTSPEFLEAGIMHDAYSGFGNEALATYQSRPWEDVHRMFYDALIVDGVPTQKAKIMFAAVYLAGPRWEDPGRDLSNVPRIRYLQEMEWCIEWITAKNPSRERIIEWMVSRETVLTGPLHLLPNWDALLAEGER